MMLRTATILIMWPNLEQKETFANKWIRQRPLNIWTEHSNCQIHRRGKPLYLYWYSIFSWLFYGIIFFYAYKSWGHDPIWYFSCICKKFSNLELCYFWALLKPGKSEIYKEMPKFEQLKKQVPVNSKKKKKFDPTLERSWYELFGIIKTHGPN